MLEKNLEFKCVRHAKVKGILSYKFTSPQQKGVPDRIFFYNSKIFLVEFKSLKGKLSKLQEFQIKQLQNQNIDVYIVNNFEYFKKIVDSYL